MVHFSIIHTKEIEAKMSTNCCGISLQWNIIQKEKDKIMIHAITWNDLENVMLKRRKASHKRPYYMIPFVWNVIASRTSKSLEAESRLVAV